MLVPYRGPRPATSEMPSHAGWCDENVEHGGTRPRHRVERPGRAERHIGLKGVPSLFGA